MNPNKKNSLMQEELKKQIEQNKGWYFIAFVGNLPRNRPYTFTLYNEPFILLRNKSRKFCCYMLLLDEKNIDNTSIINFPIVEKQGCIWLWHPRNSEADPKLIPTIDEDRSSSQT